MKPVGRYGLAVLLVCAVGGLTWLLERTLGAGYYFLWFPLFYSAVMFAALAGGVGVGIFATTLGALIATYFFLGPRLTLISVADPRDVLSLTVFCLNGVIVSVVVDRVHRATTELTREETFQKAYQKLGVLVQERTLELQKAYDRLVQETREREKLEEHLRQAHKMEAIGTLAGGIAHDFNNMLAIIIGNAELALDEIDDGAGTHQIDQVIKASKRAGDLVRQILTFSRKSDRQCALLRLGPLVEETSKLLRSTVPNTIEIKVDAETDCDTVFADPSQVQQVLLNLSSNAAYAMREEGGTLSIGLSEATFEAGKPVPSSGMRSGRYVKLTVRDTGTGIPEQIRDKIFDPFFTTKDPGQGSGMGLAVVFGIVKSCEGAISVESSENGSCFSVFLPSVRGQTEEEPVRTSLPTGTERVLVVDDEPSVVEVTSRTLMRLGYRVTSAGGGPEGLRRFAEDPYAFDLVITDHVMPDLTGMRLAEKMLMIRADLPIILFTGYCETVSPEKAKGAGISDFLMKPVAQQTMAETVRRVLDNRQKAISTEQGRPAHAAGLRRG
jgi:signal transduction histidine kinase/CheY-like chemotaxis protein